MNDTQTLSIEKDITFKEGEKISIKIQLCNISPNKKQTVMTYLDEIYQDLKLRV